MAQMFHDLPSLTEILDSIVGLILLSKHQTFACECGGHEFRVMKLLGDQECSAKRFVSLRKALHISQNAALELVAQTQQCIGLIIQCCPTRELSPSGNFLEPEIKANRG